MTLTREQTKRVTVRLLSIHIAFLLTGLTYHDFEAAGNEPPPMAQPTLLVAPRPRPTTDLYGDPLPAGAIARLGSIRLRHAGLADFSLLPGHTTARTIGRDGFIRTWNLTTGRQTQATALQGEFTSATRWLEPLFTGEERRQEHKPYLFFSPDQRFLAVVFPDLLVIWNAQTGQELKHITRPKSRMERGSFSPNGETLVILEHDRLILLEWRTGRERPVKFPILHNRNLDTYCAWQFSPDGRHLIVSSRTSSVSVFEVDSLRELYTRDGWITEAVISPDGRWLALCPDGHGFDMTLLDLKTGKEQGRVAADVYGVVFSPDGKTLSTVIQRGDKKGASLRLHDPSTMTIRARYDLDDIPQKLLFSPDSKIIACMIRNSTTLIDTSTGRVTRGPYINLFRAVFCRDGRTLVSADLLNGRLRVWDMASGRERHARSSELVNNVATPLNGRLDLAVAPNGRTVAVGVRNWGGLYVWELIDGRLVRHFATPGNEPRVSDLMFSAVGETVGAVDEEGVLRSFNVQTGALNRVVQLGFPSLPPDEIPKSKPATAWVFSTYHRVVTCVPAGKTYLLIHDLRTAAPARPVTIPGTGDICAWVWPDLALWVPKDRGTGLVIVSAATGQLKIRLPGFVPRGAPVAFSPDGRLLAALEEKGEWVVVRETATGQTVATLRPGRVQSLALTPDGRTLVTAGPGGLRVWDLATGAERSPHPARERPADEVRLPCEQVILTPDGTKAVTTAADGTGLVWALDAFPVEPWTGEIDLTADWADLSEKDARVAWITMWRLSEGRSETTTRFLRAHLKPAKTPDPGVVASLITALGDDDFQTRESVQSRLAAFGPVVTADLQRAVIGHESPEVRRRVSVLLAQISSTLPKGRPLQTLRGIAVLERIGTPEAVKVLTTLAGGATAARETEEAKAALERLNVGALRP